MNKFKEQEELYEFPYHYIPYFRSGQKPSRFRVLNWGFEYLCYMRHIVEKVESLKPQSILDVGCGDGRFFSMLTAESITRRVGVDLAKSAIHFARGFNEKAVFLSQDVAELQEEFDLVVAIEVLEHVPDKEITSFLQHIANRVKTGGYVILSVPSKVIPLKSKHFRHYDFALFEQQLNTSSTGLKILSHEYIYQENFLIRIFTRLTTNKFWNLEIGILNTLVWKYIWRSLRFGTETTGRHLVMTLQKTG